MLLRTSSASPFGRKVKMAAMRLGLLERMQIVATDTLNPDDPLPFENVKGFCRRAQTVQECRERFCKTQVSCAVLRLVCN